MGFVCAVGALILFLFVSNIDEFKKIVSNAGIQTASAVSADLSTASNFSVLAALSASSANNTTLSGSLGLSPGLETSRTGVWTVGGSESFGIGGPSETAQADALSAYNNLAGQTPDGVWGVNPSPLPGVWSTAVSATFAGPTLTLNGDYDDVWVFQIGTDFTFTGSVVMAGNAQSCNVFWQIGRDATIASGSNFKGTLIASRDITLVSGASVNGRIVSLNSSITTDNNTISGPTCEPAPTPEPSPEPEPSPSPEPEPAQVTSPSSNGGSSGRSGSRARIAGYTPIIGVNKVPNPKSITTGSGSVVYNYTVWNVGKQRALVEVTLVDDKCATVTLLSGDINSDNKLDINENWEYSCTATIATTTTNTATATGYSDDIYHISTVATAVATVVVDGSSLVSPSPQPTPSTKLPIWPNTGFPKEDRDLNSMRIIIPKIHVNSKVETVGLTDSGAIGSPVDPRNTAWFSKGPLPGKIGNAIISGHSGWKDSIPAVFDNLNQLNIGDEIFVVNEDGITTKFIIKKTRTYNENETIEDVVISNDRGAHLNLITCEGVWDSEQKSYSSRLVVFADKAI